MAFLPTTLKYICFEKMKNSWEGRSCGIEIRVREHFGRDPGGHSAISTATTLKEKGRRKRKRLKP